MSDTHLSKHFKQYTHWRENLLLNINRYHTWLSDEEISDWQIDVRLQHLKERLSEDKLNLAFVAEFSRGKSELINAIFFADYKRRLLPSTAGRTTMCPTELLYDPDRPPSIQLLPITTRSTSTTIAEYKRYPDEWVTLPLDTDSAEAMSEALGKVSETEQASQVDAAQYGLYFPDESGAPPHPDEWVEIPRWRHAVINFPHPLLKQGLVILDTPGLNAIGTEPELTLNLLPNAHAIIFMLAADTGVTKSDIDIWRNHISTMQNTHRGHLVVLNKIDGLWDELKTTEEIAAEIDKQVSSTASMLGLQADQIYPVSAQKALLAKISDDDELLIKSGLPQLEAALSEQLIPSKLDIVRDNTASEINDLISNTHELLNARMKGVNEQLAELTGLRGKNEEVVQHMMTKIEEEKSKFERGLQQFYALRSVFSNQSSQLFSHLGMEHIKQEVRQTRVAMEKSKFSTGLQHAMNSFFSEAKQNFVQASEAIAEITLMMTAMYTKFQQEHGLTETTPPLYSTFKYTKEMKRLEQTYNQHFNTLYNLLTQEQYTLTTKFFETMASRVITLYEVANREADSWLKAVMSPMETQVREHQMQLRRRLESVKRIHQATDTLEDRIAELQEIKNNINKQISELTLIKNEIEQALRPEMSLAQAA
ncbi:MAG: dynamin family protein [Betaproteobacteria bacterium]|nr:dynamin family protein [Betaproteobacteria bacterium]